MHRVLVWCRSVVLVCAVLVAVPRVWGWGVIEGRVTDNAGQGVEGLSITAVEGSGYGGGGASADSNGDYQITLSAGTYYVRTYHGTNNLIDEWFDNVTVTNNGVTPSDAQAVDVLDDQTNQNVNFTLAPGGMLSGIVTNAAGIPISNVYVRVHRYDGLGSSETVEHLTAADGRYQARGLISATYYVEADADSMHTPYLTEWYDNVAPDWYDPPLSATPVVITQGLTNDHVNFCLALGGLIAGRVTDDSGAALTDVTVRAYGDSTFTATTGENGEYAIVGLSSGRYTVVTSADPQNYVDEWFSNLVRRSEYSDSGATVLQVVPGTPTTNINFSLSVGGVITGIVNEAAGGGLVGVLVAAYTISGEDVASASFSPDGTFRLAGLPSGVYRVRARGPASGMFGSSEYVAEWFDDVPDFGFRGLADAVIPGGADGVPVIQGGPTSCANFTLELGGKISGRVTDTNGDGLAYATINLYPAEPLPPSAESWPNFSATAGSDGTYEIPGLPSGDYYVLCGEGVWYGQVARAHVDRNGGQVVRVPAGGSVSNIDIQMLAEGSISGRVTGVSGTGVGGSYVYVSAYSVSNSVEANSVHPETNGCFVIDGLPSGVYVVRTELDGENSYVDEYYNDKPVTGDTIRADAARVTVVGGAVTGGVNFALTTGGCISGRVTRAGVAEESGVALYNSAGQYLRADDTSTSGGYIFDGLPAGRYYVRTLWNAPPLVDEWYDNVPVTGACVSAGASSLAVTFGTRWSGINFDLSTNGGTVSGRITGPDGAPQADVSVLVVSANNDELGSDTTDTNGCYDVRGLPAGRFYVRTDIWSANYRNLWYTNVVVTGTSKPAQAATVLIAAGTTTTSINFALDREMPGITAMISTQAGSRVSWNTEFARSYQVQWSSDLVTWSNVPCAEGSGFVGRVYSGGESNVSAVVSNPAVPGPLFRRIRIIR